jgi:hypothetical protein
LESTPLGISGQHLQGLTMSTTGALGFHPTKWTMAATPPMAKEWALCGLILHTAGRSLGQISTTVALESCSAQLLMLALKLASPQLRMETIVPYPHLYHVSIGLFLSRCLELHSQAEPMSTSVAIPPLVKGLCLVPQTVTVLPSASDQKILTAVLCLATHSTPPLGIIFPVTVVLLWVVIRTTLRPRTVWMAVGENDVKQLVWISAD